MKCGFLEKTHPKHRLYLFRLWNIHILIFCAIHGATLLNRVRLTQTAVKTLFNSEISNGKYIYT